MALSDLNSLQQRAQSGDARAEAELGARLLYGRAAPYAPADGAKLLERAVLKNDAYALQLMGVLTALGEGRPQSWRDAIAFVAKAAEQGDARARAQLSVIGPPDRFEFNWMTLPAVKKRFDTPRVSSVQGLLPPKACAWIMERARPTLTDARVKNPERGGANKDAIRTNTGMGFSVIDTDLILQLAHARIAAVLNVPVSHQEPTNILHYTAGQEYKPHFDYLDPGEAHFAREVQTVGQRIATALIYLNVDYQGGETHFPRLNFRFKGKTGDALIFWNVSAKGEPEPKSLHAGLPPTKGEKWLLSKWVRERPVPLI